MIPPVGALGERDRAFDRLDDVGQADVGDGARQGVAAARAALSGEQAGGGEALHQLLRRGERNAGLLGELGRGQARKCIAARGGGHDHDRIVGKMGESHV